MGFLKKLRLLWAEKRREKIDTKEKTDEEINKILLTPKTDDALSSGTESPLSTSPPDSPLRRRSRSPNKTRIKLDEQEAEFESISMSLASDNEKSGHRSARRRMKKRLLRAKSLGRSVTSRSQIRRDLIVNNSLRRSYRDFRDPNISKERKLRTYLKLGSRRRSSSPKKKYYGNTINLDNTTMRRYRTYTGLSRRHTDTDLTHPPKLPKRKPPKPPVNTQTLPTKSILKKSSSISNLSSRQGVVKKYNSLSPLPSTSRSSNSRNNNRRRSNSRNRLRVPSTTKRQRIQIKVKLRRSRSTPNRMINNEVNNKSTSGTPSPKQYQTRTRRNKKLKHKLKKLIKNNRSKNQSMKPLREPIQNDDEAMRDVKLEVDNDQMEEKDDLSRSSRIKDASQPVSLLSLCNNDADVVFALAKRGVLDLFMLSELLPEDLYMLKLPTGDEHAIARKNVTTFVFENANNSL